MKTIKKIYKALDLYEISTRDGKEKEYSAYTDSRSQYAILAFVITGEQLKKSAINSLLSYVTDTTVTGKVLLASNNYVVGLFDTVNNKLIEGTLMFGTSKTILEEFNKKISHSRYEKFFIDNPVKTTQDQDFSLEVEESIDFGDIGEIANVKKQNTSQQSVFDKFTIDDLRGNVTNSRLFLQAANTLSSRDRIRKMGELTEAMSTFENELNKNTVSDQVIDDVLELSFGGALGLQEKALDLKTQKMRLQNISRSAKREREAVLGDV